MSVMAQNSSPQPQLTQVPPEPTCHRIFNTGPCAEMWRTYNQALAQRTREELQLYVNRQKTLASTEATAPLQQQIADLNRLVADQQDQIRRLQEQMQADAAQSQERVQADTASALQAKAAAHKQGLEQGAGIGAGALLLVLGTFVGAKRLTRNSARRKPVGQAASA